MVVNFIEISQVLAWGLWPMLLYICWFLLDVSASEFCQIVSADWDQQGCLIALMNPRICNFSSLTCND